MLYALKKSAPGLGLALLVSLAACTVGPNYVRPDMPAPPAFKETREAGSPVQPGEADVWRQATPAEGALRGTWWEMYGDPLLNELEAQVDVSNQNILSAEAQYRQARALADVARAGYFPTVSAGASYTRSRRPLESSGRGPSSVLTSDWSMPVEAVWEPDIWGRVRRTVEAGESTAQASAADLELARLTARIELAQDYFQLRALDSARQILDANVAALRESLTLTRNRYRSGVVSLADVAQSETQLKSTQAQALDVGVQRSRLEHAIALLIGRSPAEVTIPAAPLTAVPPAIPAGLPSALLERRPDIAAAERRVAAANARIGAAEAAYYPNVSLSVSGGFQASSLSKLLNWPNRIWSLGPSVSAPIFTGGLTAAQVEQARAAWEATVADYRQTVLTGFGEVEDNLAALRILEEEARVQEEAVAAARQSLTIATNQYKAGQVSYLNVIVAQAAALNAERNLVDVQGRRMTASVLLVRALGGGWHSSALAGAGGSEAIPATGQQ